MVANDPRLFEWKLCLGAGGQLPSIGVRASHKDGLGGQPVIIVLGLDIGEREREAAVPCGEASTSVTETLSSLKEKAGTPRPLSL